MLRSLKVLAPLLSVATALTVFACTKSDQPGGAGTASTAASAPSAATSASAAASGTAQATDTAAASGSAVASATPSAVASDTPPTTKAAGDAGAPAASSSASAAPNCGTKPLPDCPLQAWMKANMNPALTDAPALATALDKAATFAPAGYANWASIAKDGAKAAKGGDISAAKASCRTCHDQYKKKYQAEMRARKI